MPNAAATGTSPDGSTLETLYDALFDPATPNGDSDVDERFVRLGSLDQLHFLDAHACLLLARSWHGAPAWRPYPDLPAVPVTHVAVVLWLVSPGFLAGLPDGAARLRGAMGRMRRPAAAMMLYVLLGRWIAGSGVATALAAAIAGSLGPLAPYAIPPLGFLAGMVTGSNVGAASSLMAVQAGLGLAAGLPPWLAPGLHNFAGSVGAMHSFAGTAMVCGLLADGTRPADLWRAALPVVLAALAVGWAAVALLPALV